MTPLIAVKLPWANFTLKLPEHETQEIAFLKRSKIPCLNHGINHQTNFGNFEMSNISTV